MALIPTDVAAGTNISSVDVKDVILATEKAIQTVKTERAAFTKANEAVTPGSFGGYDGARVVVTAHTKAHGKATETLDRVTSTLTLFSTELAAVLKTVDNLEDATESSFRKIADVSEAAVAGTTTTPGGDFALNDQQAPADRGPAPEQPPADDPAACTPEGDA